MAYRAVIADDHALVRIGIRGIVEASGRFSIIADAADGVQAVTQVKKHQPDILFLDIAMPHSNGIEVIEEVRRWSPDTRIFVLTGLTSGGLLRQAHSAGAAGIFLKSDGMEAIVSGALEVLDGKAAISPRVRAALDKPQFGADLTPRERQILNGLVRGETLVQLAERYAISINTADKHRASIMRKLDVHTTGELIAMAHREGLLDAERFT